MPTVIRLIKMNSVGIYAPKWRNQPVLLIFLLLVPSIRVQLTYEGRFKNCVFKDLCTLKQDTSFLIIFSTNIDRFSFTDSFPMSCLLMIFNLTLNMFLHLIGCVAQW